MIEAPMDFSTVLKEAGPFTAPLCFGMMFAIRWLLLERLELVKSLKESQERERDMGEKRTKALMDSAVAMGESSSVIEKALDDHDRLLQKVLDRWESQKS